MLNKYCADIRKMISDGILEKKAYHDILNDMDTLLVQYLDIFDYHHPVNDIPLFNLSTDSRLENARFKRASVVEHPEYSIQEGMKSYTQHIQNFLQQYHIGYLHHMHMDDIGLLHIDIHCLIVSSCGDDKVLNRLNFEKQINFLKSQGYVFGKDSMDDLVLTNSSENIDRLNELLSSKGAKRICYTLGDGISEIQFILRVKDIQNFNEKFEPVTLDISDTLNDNEIAKVKKNLQDLEFSAASMQELGEGMVNICGHLTEMAMNDICKIFGFSGIISQRCPLYYQEERNKNLETRAIENEIAERLSSVDFANHAVTLNNKLEKFFSSKFGFRLSSFEIDKYGTFHLMLHYIPEDCVVYCEHEVISPKELHDTFETENIDGEDRPYILDSISNKEKIEQILTTAMPSSRIYQFSARKFDNLYAIYEMEVFIENAVDVFQLS